MNDRHFQPDLIIEEPEWHKIVVFAGIEDQECLLFMRTDTEDFGREQIAIAGLGAPEVEQLRDHLTKWLEWNQQREPIRAREREERAACRAARQEE